MATEMSSGGGGSNQQVGDPRHVELLPRYQSGFRYEAFELIRNRDPDIEDGYGHEAHQLVIIVEPSEYYSGAPRSGRITCGGPGEGSVYEPTSFMYEQAPRTIGGHAIGGQLNGGMLTVPWLESEDMLLEAMARARGHAIGGHAIGGQLNGVLEAMARARGHAIGGHAIGGQLNGDMLTVPWLELLEAAMARARGHAIGGHAIGSQLNGGMLTALDETGGRFYLPQQADQGLGAPFFGAENGAGGKFQRALESVFGGLVPLCYTVVDDILKGGSPGYIKAVAYAGLGLITGFTFVGIISKKRANAAVRVVASTAIAAASTALVYKVSENVYIKCICGIIGVVATLATAAIDW